MQKKLIFVLAVIAVVFAITEVSAQPMRFRADMTCNFQHERTVEIVFDPEVGDQKAQVFYGPGKMSSAPPSPTGGEIVEMGKNGEEWSFKRDCTTRFTKIKRDESGKMTISFLIGAPGRGHFAEGELKPVVQ
jgi:hypothetical protein